MEYKVMPSDLEAEDKIIFWLKNHPEDIILIRKKISKDDFYSEKNRKIFEEIRISHYNNITEVRNAIQIVKKLSDKRKEIQMLTEKLISLGVPRGE